MSVLAVSALRATVRRTIAVSYPSVAGLSNSIGPSNTCEVGDTSNMEQTTQNRLISSSTRTQNNAAAVPIADTVRNVAARAQESVMVKAGEEGFKAGVLATVLGASALTAGYLIVSPSAGKTVNANELL